MSNLLTPLLAQARPTVKGPPTVAASILKYPRDTCLTTITVLARTPDPATPGTAISTAEIFECPATVTVDQVHVDAKRAGVVDAGAGIDLGMVGSQLSATRDVGTVAGIGVAEMLAFRADQGLSS